MCKHNLRRSDSPFVAITLLAVIQIFSSAVTLEAQEIAHLQGEMVGEVTDRSAILHSRLTAGALAADGDVPGARGVARFELSGEPDFKNSTFTDWLDATADRDFIVQVKVADLKPGTRYYYRLVFGPNREQVRTGPRRTFRTNVAADVVSRHSFVVVT